MNWNENKWNRKQNKNRKKIIWNGSEQATTNIMT